MEEYNEVILLQISRRCCARQSSHNRPGNATDYASLSQWKTLEKRREGNRSVCERHTDEYRRRLSTEYSWVSIFEMKFTERATFR